MKGTILFANSSCLLVDFGVLLPGGRLRKVNYVVRRGSRGRVASSGLEVEMEDMGVFVCCVAQLRRRNIRERVRVQVGICCGRVG